MSKDVFSSFEDVYERINKSQRKKLRKKKYSLKICGRKYSMNYAQQEEKFEGATWTSRKTL